MKYFLFLLFGAVVGWQMLHAQPQRRANIWHFGNREGMDFSCGVPMKVTNTKIVSVEGATSICDENGQLLFYTNGGGGRRGSSLINGAIWNRNRDLMYDMQNLDGGGISSAQGAIVVPDPAAGNRYYLFTVDEFESIGFPQREHRGLSYLLINMNLNNGLGVVNQSNNRVYRPAVECITAARHSNGSDYWILTVDFDSRDLIVTSVTASGVQSPLQYPRQIGTVPSVLKLSPNGLFLFDGVALYHFNASDGSIEWMTTLPELNNYAFSFSPSSRYLFGVTASGSVIVRFDLQAADIAGSMEKIQPLGEYSARYMQIGPDGNIYVNTPNFGHSFNQVGVSVIRCPDSDTPEVVFDLLTFGVDVSIGAFASLNNIADFWFDNLLHELETDTFQARICDGADLLIESHCVGAEYRWSTGAVTKQISVVTPGEYRVSVTTGCFTVVETFQVSNGASPTIAIEYEHFSSFCTALPLNLTAVDSDADSLFWSTGATGNSIVIERGGQYSATAVNTCGTVVAAVNFPTEECCSIYVPNVFSPNDDGVNDHFGTGVFQCPFIEYCLQIFSRWGELVFETQDSTETWNGKSGSKERSPGVYVWKITYVLENDPSQRQQVKSGELTLLR
ncbi:MAG: gliding motility-associated C-terminal domain-containing protein [Saprospiraceae bacterium]|nr:gliding motility-associated C-terminal domain-containing protein [Saprospiraceae bacterium]